MIKIAQRNKAELALMGVTIIWGTTFVTVKNALADVSTFLFLAVRFSLAALVLLMLYRKGVQWKKSGPAVFAGCLLFAAYAFQTVGLETTTPSKSAFLTGLCIPMVPLASSLIYRSRPRAFELAGIAIASAGMALMTLPAGRFDVSKGDFLSLLCAVAFAVHIVVVGHYSNLIGFKTLVVIQIATAALLGLGTFRFVEPVRFAPTAAVAIAVIVTGLLATALAFRTQAWAQQHTSSTRTALIFALEPVAAFVTSYLLYGETLTTRGLLGAGLILIGILAVELRKSDIETQIRLEPSN